MFWSSFRFSARVKNVIRLTKEPPPDEEKDVIDILADGNKISRFDLSTKKMILWPMWTYDVLYNVLQFWGCAAKSNRDA